MTYADPTLPTTGAIDLTTDTDGNFTGQQGSVPEFVVGDARNNTINAGNGIDTVVGGDGNDAINGENGDDILLGGTGTDTIKGGNGDDYINGGADNDLLTGEGGQGNGGADTFAFDWEQHTTPGETILFREGDAPSDKANAKAWENYTKQALEQGFTDIVGHTEGGHALYGKITEGMTIFENKAGVDTITDFNFAEGDKIQLNGIADAEAFLSHLSYADEGDHVLVKYDGQTIIDVHTTANFSLDWFQI